LPSCYPNWNTVHRYHLAWSRDGTWEAIVDRLRTLVREREGRDPEPSAGIVDARSVQGASTVTSPTRGFDAGKRVSGRKTFGVVDTLVLLVAVVVVAANVSDNAGGCTRVDRARSKSARLIKLWCDAGFKRAFARHCRHHRVSPTRRRGCGSRTSLRSSASRRARTRSVPPSPVSSRP
jgi:transposase